jgi:protease I
MSNDSKRTFSRREALAASFGAVGVSTVFPGSSIAAESNESPRGKKVLVAIGDFSEGLETYYMIYRLMEAGVKPVVAAPSVKRLQMVVHDFDPAYSNYIEMTGYCIETDVAFEKVEPQQFHGLLIPGGRGPEQIRQDPRARKITHYFLKENKPLGAMCHGPQLLYATQRLDGRRVAAYSGIRADVELAGADYVDEPVVVDGALVTSRGWPDLPYFMPKFLEVLARHS